MTIFSTDPKPSTVIFLPSHLRLALSFYLYSRCHAKVDSLEPKMMLAGSATRTCLSRTRWNLSAFPAPALGSSRKKLHPANHNLFFQHPMRVMRVSSRPEQVETREVRSSEWTVVSALVLTHHSHDGPYEELFHGVHIKLISSFLPLLSDPLQSFDLIVEHLL